MRFRPANIRLINRRPNLPRLLLALSLNNDKSKDNDKNDPIDVQRLTGHSISGKSANAAGTFDDPVQSLIPSRVHMKAFAFA